MSVKPMTLALAIGFASISFAQASTLKFSVVETWYSTDQPVTDSYSFTLPNPPDVQAYVIDDYFQTDGYWFFNDFNNGGFTNAPTGIYYEGPQLYSGPENSPAFLFGTFDLVGFYDPVFATVTITSVPEPSTWALMLVAFGGLGFAGYRRKLRRRHVRNRLSVRPKRS